MSKWKTVTRNGLGYASKTIGMVDRLVTIIQDRLMQRETRNNKLANQTHQYITDTTRTKHSVLPEKGSDHTQIPTFRDDSRGGRETCSGIDPRSDHCTPFFLSFFLQFIAPAFFFPLVIRRHKGIISVLISGLTKQAFCPFSCEHSGSLFLAKVQITTFSHQHDLLLERSC